jgi:hypothetical protein
LQTLLVLVKRQPPVGKKLLIIGTSSTGEIMESMGLGKQPCLLFYFSCRFVTFLDFLSLLLLLLLLLHQFKKSSW